MTLALAVGPVALAAGAARASTSAGGDQLWLARYDGGNGDDVGSAVAASPDGSTVFVTGSIAVPPWRDFETLAYDAATGNELWSARYNVRATRTTSLA